MKTQANYQRTFPVLAPVPRAINGRVRLSSPAAASLLALAEPLRMNRKWLFTRMSLVAAALALGGAGAAFADGRVSVTAATGGRANPATTANGAWTTGTGPIMP